MGPVSVEAKTCESPSQNFKGMCMLQSNCANVCLGEGFQGGYCHGLRRRCICSSQCWSIEQCIIFLLITWLFSLSCSISNVSSLSFWYINFITLNFSVICVPLMELGTSYTNNKVNKYYIILLCKVWFGTLFLIKFDLFFLIIRTGYQVFIAFSQKRTNTDDTKYCKTNKPWSNSKLITDRK
jgi:Gamma-thionin family